MPKIRTESVLTKQRRGAFKGLYANRTGDIRPERDYQILGESDIRGVIPIRKGLQFGDLLAVISFGPTRAGSAFEPIRASYVVADVCPLDGSGILVETELMEKRVSDFVNNRITRAWNEASESGIHPADFGLMGLQKYLGISPQETRPLAESSTS